MITYIFNFLFGFVFGWTVIWLKYPFFKLAVSSLGLLDTILSKEDDSFKIQKLNDLIKDCIKFLSIILFKVLLIVVFFYLTYHLSKFLTESSGNHEKYSFIFFAIGSIFPFFNFKKYKPQYSELSQLLHRLILDNYNIGIKLLSLQIRKTSNPEPKIFNSYKAILISGLARSGTTALTRHLYKSGLFSSLNYSNMPFLLYPRFWSKFYSPSKKELKERAHNDGIEVGYSSVEALEEYFFKVITNDSYILKDSLKVHSLTRKQNILYRRYIKSICFGKNIYLSKNNNNILRIKSIIDLNKDILPIFLIREPLKHALSLQQQHVNFKKLQKKDPFVLEYMNWLGHHEFGKNHKPFSFVAESKINYDPKEVEYWLVIWINYYSYILDLNYKNIICFEEFIKEPSMTISKISNISNLKIKKVDFNKFVKKEIKYDKKVDEALMKKATALYEKILDISIL